MQEKKSLMKWPVKISKMESHKVKQKDVYKGIQSKLKREQLRIVVQICKKWADELLELTV
jgi:hypothetical protein